MQEHLNSTSPEEKAQVLKNFMEEFFPFDQFLEIKFFKEEMRGDYEAQAARVCQFLGYETVYEYGAEKSRAHISYEDPEGKPFITEFGGIYNED